MIQFAKNCQTPGRAARHDLLSLINGERTQINVAELTARQPGQMTVMENKDLAVSSTAKDCKLEKQCSDR